MTADAIFPIHSVTKTITSMAVMMLVDRGKIALDDPVSKYIPSFGGMKVGVEKKDDAGQPVLDLVPLRRPINIEDLLLHTSGITYGFYGEGPGQGGLSRASISVISTMPDLPRPGSRNCRWPNSRARCGTTDTLIDILGRVIEVVSGQSLYQFEKENLLDPLGMATTKFFLTRSGRAGPLCASRLTGTVMSNATRWT